MKRLLLLFALLTIPAFCQESIDHSQAQRVTPWPVRSTFPGSGRVGDHITYTGVTPPADYVYDGSAWQAIGGSGGSGSFTFSVLSGAPTDNAALATALGSKATKGLTWYFSPGQNGAACDLSTDDTTAFNALLVTVNAAGGGTIVVQGACRMTSQIVFPNDGGSPAKQSPIRLTGYGSSANGQWTAPPLAPSNLNLPLSGLKIITTGVGNLEIDHIALTDSNTDCGTYFETTNTTVSIHDVLFQGALIPTTGTTCHVAIQLGTPSVFFQGYLSEFHHNVFDQVSTLIQFNEAANAVSFTDNTSTPRSGGIAAIDMSLTSEFHRGNYFAGNLLELSRYQYGVLCGAACIGNAFIGNATWDSQGATTLASYNMTGSSDNIIISAHDDIPSPLGSWVQFIGCGALNTCQAGGLNQSSIGSPTAMAANGAASRPPLSMTGTWYSGGTQTTTKPQTLIECSGASSTAWNPAGSGLGINACAGFSGNLMDLQVNGVYKLQLDASGNAYLKGNVNAANGATSLGTFGLYAEAGGVGYSLQRMSSGVTKHTNAAETVQNVIHAVNSSISSGFGSTPSIAGTDTNGRLTVGSGGTAATGAITFGTAWGTAPACTANNETTVVHVQAVATTTTLTLTSSTSWGAGDKLTWLCFGY